MYTMVYYSAEKHLYHEICRQMNGTKKKSILSEVNQTQKDKYGMYSIISGQ